MNTSLSLPTDLTIDNVRSLHSDWRSGLAGDRRPRATGFEFRVRADQIDDIDAAGLQLLLSLRRSVRTLGGLFQIIDPSTPLVIACSSLGLASLLAAPTHGVMSVLKDGPPRRPPVVRLDVAALSLNIFDPVCALQPEDDPSGGNRWHVAVCWGRETFRNGIDPIAMLDDVHRDGVMTVLCCDIDQVPSLENVDPEDCFLAFGFDLRTTKSLREVESALSFVRQEVALSIRRSRFVGESAKKSIFDQ